MKDILTGKNKEQFEKWLFKEMENEFQRISLPDSVFDIELFYKKDIRMQSGVITAYYDFLGYKVLINYNDQANWFYYVRLGKRLLSSKNGFNSRPEAQLEAFKAANKLINKEL